MDIHFLLIRNNLTSFHIIKNNLENFIRETTNKLSNFNKLETLLSLSTIVLKSKLRLRAYNNLTKSLTIIYCPQYTFNNKCEFLNSYIKKRRTKYIDINST